MRNCIRPGGTSNVALDRGGDPDAGLAAGGAVDALCSGTRPRKSGRPSGASAVSVTYGDALVAGPALARHRRNRLPRERDLRLAVLAARGADPETRRAAARRLDERRQRRGHRRRRLDARRVARAASSAV